MLVEFAEEVLGRLATRLDASRFHRESRSHAAPTPPGRLAPSSRFAMGSAAARTVPGRSPTSAEASITITAVAHLADDLAGQELGERDPLPGGADPELAVNLVRDVADLDHLRHVTRIFTCAKHVKLGHAPATPRQTL